MTFEEKKCWSQKDLSLFFKSFDLLTSKIVVVSTTRCAQKSPKSLHAWFLDGGQELLNIPAFDLSIWSIQEIPQMTLLVGINLSFWEIHAVFAVAITDILEVFSKKIFQSNQDFWGKVT